MKYKNASDINVFNHDVNDNRGYIYSTNAQLSSKIANRRFTEVTLTMAKFKDKRVLDIGCGDGTYTVELFDKGTPVSIHGFDLAREAIDIAQKKVSHRKITFSVHGAYDLPYASNSFDIAYLRGVLHHMDRPLDAIGEALRVASFLVIIEPNGYNPILKLIEKFSNYHIVHNETSYTSLTIDGWIRKQNGMVIKRRWVNLVPMFCPDWMARLLKIGEPLIERLPLINMSGCGIYALTATRREERAG